MSEKIYHKKPLNIYTHAICGQKILGREIDTHHFATKENPVNCDDCINYKERKKFPQVSTDLNGRWCR